MDDSQYVWRSTIPLDDLTSGAVGEILGVRHATVRPRLGDGDGAHDEIASPCPVARFVGPDDPFNRSYKSCEDLGLLRTTCSTGF